MSFWTAIAIIVTIACVTSVLNTWLSQRRHHAKERNTADDRVEALEQEFRERIQNLERIVTDASDDLEHKFRELERDH